MIFQSLMGLRNQGVMILLIPPKETLTPLLMTTIHIDYDI